MHRRQWELFAAIVGLVITSIAVFVVHSMAAKEYYSANSASMRLVAEKAVMVGIQYLPAEPSAAVAAAEQSAELGGVAPSEIETKIAADEQQITLCLKRKVPNYIAFLAVGLPSREIQVTAKAQRVFLNRRQTSI